MKTVCTEGLLKPPRISDLLISWLSVLCIGARILCECVHGPTEINHEAVQPWAIFDGMKGFSKHE